MSAEQGRKKLFNAQGEYGKLGKGMEAASGAGSAAANDDQLDSKRHDRGYNPVNDAERATISEKLNGDAGRYRKGPGPM